MKTTQEWYTVDLQIKKKTVGFTQVMANSPQEAAQLVGGILNLKAKKSYMKISPRTNGVINKKKGKDNE